MPKHSVRLGEREFPSKIDAKKYFKEMLRKYKPGDRVSDADGLELALLLHRHPRATDKIGPGIKHFEVMSADFNSRCFWVVRQDETVERFSYKACIDGTENI